MEIIASSTLIVVTLAVGFFLIFAGVRVAERGIFPIGAAFIGLWLIAMAAIGAVVADKYFFISNGGHYELRDNPDGTRTWQRATNQQEQ